MRIRRKKGLDERVAQADNIILIDKQKVNVLEAIKDKRYIETEKLFGNANPVDLEIGCGKGKFVTEMAKKHPERNYLAVDCIANIIIVAADLAKQENLCNVKFLNTGAEYLPRYIKEHSIENLYLNFSPPYPQSSYENRRLTNDRYLSVFKPLLTACGRIYQKTDDRGFFEYSMAKFDSHGFMVENVSDKVLDGEVQTEFEIKYKNMGVPIYKLIAKLK